MPTEIAFTDRLRSAIQDVFVPEIKAELDMALQEALAAARHKLDGFRIYRKKVPVLAKQMKRPFIVETLEGTMRGQPGDYLCVGIEGESWVVRRDIFEGTYELAPGPGDSPD